MISIPSTLNTDKLIGVGWVEGAKRPETRAARIGELINLLKAGKKQR